MKLAQPSTDFASGPALSKLLLLFDSMNDVAVIEQEKPHLFMAQMLGTGYNKVIGTVHAQTIYYLHWLELCPLSRHKSLNNDI